MWMAPVDEVGHGNGRRYHEPVKIKLLPDGTARVTEHDGDQFLVKRNGTFKPLRTGIVLTIASLTIPAITRMRDAWSMDAIMRRTSRTLP